MYRNCTIISYAVILEACMYTAMRTFFLSCDDIWQEVSVVYSRDGMRMSGQFFWLLYGLAMEITFSVIISLQVAQRLFCFFVE